MISTNISDHRDIGLNAEWAVSTYQIGKEHYIFDNEDGSYSLCIVDIELSGCGEGIEDLHCGTFAECVEHYENSRIV